ncbi:hypothetical protein J5N97_003737 [Dioscorea zingiberensis]|uniref:Uncharacterized protein n=1 Tax=Dioscorea zingiberensis TaxID=325984 RepID=A0A9D5HQV9_9LILI|nr:hypothetical protein J5N97_003737 [Dioscorea zingiberensis]
MEKRDLNEVKKGEYDKLLECFDLRVDSYLTSDVLQASGLYTMLDKRPVNPQAAAGNLLSIVRAKEAQLRASKLEKRKKSESSQATTIEEPPQKKRGATRGKNLNLAPEARGKTSQASSGVPVTEPSDSISKGVLRKVGTLVAPPTTAVEEDSTLTPIEEVDSDDAVSISSRRFCVRSTPSVPPAIAVPEPQAREDVPRDAVGGLSPAHLILEEIEPAPEQTVPLRRSKRGRLRVEEPAELTTSDEIAANLRITAISESQPSPILSDRAARLLEERRDLRLALSLREGDYQNLKDELFALKAERDKIQASLDSFGRKCQKLLDEKMKLEGKIRPLEDEIRRYRAAADEMIKNQGALEDRCKLVEGKWGQLSETYGKTASELVQIKEQVRTLTEENNKLQRDLDSKSILLNEANHLIVSLEAEKERLSSEVVSHQETLSPCSDQIKEAEAICTSEKAGGYDLGFLAGSTDAVRVLRELVLLVVPEETLKTLPVDFSSLTYKRGLKYLTGEDRTADSENEWIEDPSSGEEGGAGAEGD